MKKTINITFMRALTASILLFSAFTATVKAQDSSQAIEVGKIYLAPLPVIASNPAFGLIYGVAASGGIFLGEPANTSMSSAMATATYSTKKQLLFTLKSNVYTS